MRKQPYNHSAEEYTDRHGNTRSDHHIYMNGRAVIEFTLREVPKSILTLCERAGLSLDQIDAVIPHQASATVLNGVRKKLGLPPERFIVCMEDIGNTVSCSVPIALKRAATEGRIGPGDRLLLAGFGVGLSWGATIVRLPTDFQR